MVKKGRLLGGVLLITGTTVGGAVLAMPVSTGFAGFFPSMLLFFLCWAYLTFTAFLLLEVNLWLKGDSNIITMAKKTVGLPGQILGWCAYLFLLYALTTAYLAVSSNLFTVACKAATGVEIPLWLRPLPLLLIFGFFVYKGTRSVDLVNRLLMGGLFITFFVIMGLVAPEINTDLLAHQDWGHIPMATSVIVTAFGYHIIIPSLTTYFDGDRKKLIQSLVIGSFIPLVMYCLWEFAMMGTVPLEGPYSLKAAYESGMPVTHPLGLLLDTPYISVATRFFEFCAVVTSFLGVSLSLADFFADGLRIKKTRWGRLLLCILTFVPPFVITMTNPRAFLTALEYAGTYGVIVLLGLLPALMVWWGRYRRGFPKEAYHAPGGKPALILIIIVSLAVIALETARKLSLWGV